MAKFKYNQYEVYVEGAFRSAILLHQYPDKSEELREYPDKTELEKFLQDTDEEKAYPYVISGSTLKLFLWGHMAENIGPWSHGYSGLALVPSLRKGVSGDAYYRAWDGPPITGVQDTVLGLPIALLGRCQRLLAEAGITQHHVQSGTVFFSSYHDEETDDTRRAAVRIDISREKRALLLVTSFER